jgi:hypothetical protein
MLARNDCIDRLREAGISRDDAEALRRIAMTLHRWHELECGDSNDYASWCITRGKQTLGPKDPATGKRAWLFEHDDNGTPFEERHIHTENKARYTPIADRERGALKRLAAIMARYPGFASYVQGDPRGAALYIMRPGDVKEGDDLSSVYTRGIAVYK